MERISKRSAEPGEPLPKRSRKTSPAPQRVDENLQPSASISQVSGNVSTFVAGGISKHLKNWKELTNDEFILDMVKGSKIPIDDLGESNQTSFRKNDISKENMPKIESEIQKLLKTKVIEETETEEGEHISPIFVVPKPDGSVRLILNLKKFNESVEY